MDLRIGYIELARRKQMENNTCHTFPKQNKTTKKKQPTFRPIRCILGLLLLLFFSVRIDQEQKIDCIRRNYTVACDQQQKKIQMLISHSFDPMDNQSVFYNQKKNKEKLKFLIFFKFYFNYHYYYFFVVLKLQDL